MTSYAKLYAEWVILDSEVNTEHDIDIYSRTSLIRTSLIRKLQLTEH